MTLFRSILNNKRGGIRVEPTHSIVVGQGFIDTGFGYYIRDCGELIPETFNGIVISALFTSQESYTYIERINTSLNAIQLTRIDTGKQMNLTPEARGRYVAFEVMFESSDVGKTIPLSILAIE